MRSPHPGPAFTPERPEIAVERLRYEEVRRFVRRKLPQVQPVFVDRTLTWLSGALLLEVKKGSGAGHAHDLDALLDERFPAAVLEVVQRDEAALWVLTQGLIDQALRRRLSPDQRAEERGISQELSGRALTSLEGGRKVLRGYLEEGGRTNFWAYLRAAAENAAISQLRLKGESRDYWKGKDLHREAPASTGEQGGAPPLAAPSSHAPDRQLLRRMRSAQRASLVRELEGLARSRPDDPDFRVAVAYVEWLRADPEREPSQSEFAKQTGRPQGTVNSSLKRFRQKLARGALGRVDRQDLYSTVGGGR